MSVYVDKALNRYGRMFMSHMVADTLDELHAMADTIGIQRRWFQANASTPHYDVCQTKKAMAIAYGAIELDRAPYVEVIRRLRKAAAGSLTNG